MLGVGCSCIYMRIGLTHLPLSLQEITKEGSTANTVTRCFVVSWELNYSCISDITFSSIFLIFYLYYKICENDI